MRREISGRRVLITGASSGIGRCLAERAALEGAHVALAARSKDKLQELSQALNGRGAVTIAVPTDITVDTERQRLLNTVLEEFGGLDILVNNAAVTSFGHFSTSSEDILRRIMEVNFFAPTELIRLAIPALTKGRQPAIVNVASFVGRRGIPAWSEYSASKFALCGMTEALRGEMARFDIDVLLVIPGLAHGDAPRQLLRNEGRMKISRDQGMPAQKVAACILQAVKKNKAETVLGREARWLLRVNRFLPGLVDRVMIRRVRQLYAPSAHTEESS